ncbi:DUF6397 family protein [Streptomyces sp. GSL17-113]|uniref:DUF6397 family protein n=1 Tax=Streptomyces sp. GSL17-113 TaxID=3115365 RepID=UPI002E782B61|nr:DUF6397 family protein [Streptomyces sp. GSL17-113]
MQKNTAGNRTPAPTAAEVTPRTAARELGLRPKELELAVQLGLVRSVPGAPSGPRRVPRAELERVRRTPDFPGGLRERVRVMGAGEGAALLDVSASRFARLARLGCFTPVSFYVNRYRTVVWLYLAQELRDFAENDQALRTGHLPEGLRAALEAGMDERARGWRSRRVLQLTRHAATPWERAAARASVLSEVVLAEAVPEPDERARLSALRHCLVETRSESEPTRRILEKLSHAEGEDEIRWHRLVLDAELEAARAAEPFRAAFPAPSARQISGPAGSGAGPEGHRRPEPGTARPVTTEGRRGRPRRRWLGLGRRSRKATARPATG